MQRIYPNNANVLSTLTASDVVSSAAYKRTAADRSGGGSIDLTGDYTGDQDETLEVEIVSTTIGANSLISEPLYAGQGSGEISGVTADPATPAQELLITLKDLGEPTTTATAPIGPVVLKAKASGSPGNAITLTVDRSGIGRTATDFATPDALSAGSNGFIGDEWDFGAKILDEDGQIPADAPRIQLGDQPKFYRQYKTFVDGAYVYSFTPTPQQDVRKGERVFDVTGTYIVTVTDGVTTEPYGDTADPELKIRTLFDFLDQLAPSLLIEVDGPVVNDRSPNGMAIDELSERTEPYLFDLTFEGGNALTGLEDVSVDSTAPTQVLTVTCTNNNLVGQETWRVEGDVSGIEDIPAVTGEAYNSPVNFTIPTKETSSVAPTGSITLDLNARSATPPVLCHDKIMGQLGARAVDGVFTFTYRHREKDFSCDEIITTGRPDPFCLGVDLQIGTEDLPAALKSRALTLHEWQRDFINANSEVLDETTVVTGDENPPDTLPFVTEAQATEASFSYARQTGFSAVLKVDRVDIDAAEQATAIFFNTLKVMEAEFPGGIPAAALTLWDTELTNLGADFLVINGNEGSDWWRLFDKKLRGTDIESWETSVAIGVQVGILTNVVTGFMQRYQAQMDRVLVEAGIEPPLGENPLSTGRCWTDLGGPFFVSNDGLQGLFPNAGYHSSKTVQIDGESTIVSTQEFFVIAAIAGVSELQDGDVLTITISGVSNNSKTYQIDDTFSIQTVTASPTPFSGGLDGNNTITWSVVSTVGLFDDYDLLTTSPNTYTDNGISFLITPGGIDFALADQFQIAIEGGTIRYRFLPDAFSAPLQMSTAPISLADGISAVIVEGAAPSFAPGDLFTFDVPAINGPAQTNQPTDGAWRFTGVSDLVADLGLGPPPATDVVFVHGLTGSATVQIEAATDAGFTSIVYDETDTLNPGVHVHRFGSSLEIRYWRYTFTPDTGLNEVTWAWMGLPFAPPKEAEGAQSTFVDEIHYQGSGLNNDGQYLAFAPGATVNYQLLLDADAKQLTELVRHAFEFDHGRLVFLTHEDALEEAILVRVEDLVIPRQDRRNMQAPVANRKILGMQLELKGVLL